jgi:uncharacterized delta-60 repeat protein
MKPNLNRTIEALVSIERLEARCLLSGEQDPSYGEFGYALDGAGHKWDAELTGDGKLLVLRAIDDWASEVVRFRTDGRIDRTFGDEGIVKLPLGKRMDLDALGRIVVGGISVDEEVLIARLTPDGELDTSFGDAGLVRWRDAEVVGRSAMMAVEVGEDGSIIVAVDGSMETHRDDRSFVWRFDSSGEIDTSFTLDRVAVPRSLGSVQFVLPLADGRMLLVGNPHYSETGPIFVARLNEDGSLDSGFGVNGISLNLFNPADSEEFVHGAVLLGDGKILLAGHNDTWRQLPFVIRLNGDGSRDSSFGVNGAVTHGGYGWSGLAIGPDGKIALNGARLLPRGKPDPLFDRDGSIDTSSSARIVLVQQDGKVILVDDQFIARLVVNPLETRPGWLKVKNGVLRIVGSNGNDQMRVGFGLEDGQLWIGAHRNGAFERFRAKGIRSVLIDMLDGNDKAWSNFQDDLEHGHGPRLALPVVVYGGPGDDEIRAQSLRETLYGGLGNDLIEGFRGAERLIGGPGNDTIRGGGGDDRILGGDGDDSLFGGVGDDHLTGGAGSDTISGENGRDWFLDGDPLSVDVLDGGMGLDTVLRPVDVKDRRTWIERVSN